MKEHIRSKWEQQIAKDIASIREAATQATMTEVLFLLALMHNVRLRSNEPEVAEDQNPRVLHQIVAQTQEAIRYGVSMILKFGTLGIRHEESGRFLLDHALAVRILKLVEILNAKYEFGAILELADARPFGERDRYVEVDLRRVTADPVASRFMNYFARSELAAELVRTRGGSGLTAFVDTYLDRFRPAAELIPSVLGVELETVARFVTYIGEEFRSRMVAAAAAMGVKEEDDLIPAGTDEWYQRYSRILIFTVDGLCEALGDDVLPLIDRLTFVAADFDERNLRVHALWRTPLIRFGPVLVICPEFLLDSLHPNTHYSLLEAASKAEYMTRAARSFVDRVASVAAEHGWVEKARDVFIRKGKRDLGDLDLVFEKDGVVLAVEAKGHVLPLSVYFHELEATRQHLARSRREIEAKVQARIEHLRDHHAEFGLPDSFRYVVVTQSPEVLSHFSSLLVLTLDEFAVWISQTPLLATFDEVYREAYGHLPDLSADDLKTLLEEGVLAFGVAPPAGSPLPMNDKP